MSDLGQLMTTMGQGLSNSTGHGNAKEFGKKPPGKAVAKPTAPAPMPPKGGSKPC